MSTDRRHQRSERTRRALIESALDLFESRGFDNTTVDEIAARAGVSPRSFFHHFRTKEGVLFDGYPERLAESTRRFRSSRVDGSLWDALYEASTAVTEAIIEQPDVFLRRSRLYSEASSLRATMLLINEEWIDGLTVEIMDSVGGGPGDPAPRLVATIANSATRSAIDTWAARGGGDYAAVVRETYEMIRPAVVSIEQRMLMGTAAGPQQ